MIDEVKKEKLTLFGQYVANCLPKFVQQVQAKLVLVIIFHNLIYFKFAGGDELELLIHPSGVVPVMGFLKGHHPSQFTNFIFACGLDVPTRKNRFEIIYALLSHRFNARIRIRTYADEVIRVEVSI